MFVPDDVRYENLEEFRELREDFVRDRVTCTHWPLEMVTASLYFQKNETFKNIFYYRSSIPYGYRSS
jgi:hypothetical protein